jgi:hypothetical protein
VDMTELRTTLDSAERMRWLVDGVSPKAEDSRLVQDTLNTHVLAALSEAFPSRSTTHVAAHRVPFHSEARQLAEHGAP